MHTSSTWGRQRRSNVGTLVLIVVGALMISGIDAGSAYGQAPERRLWRQEQREHGRERQEERRYRWRERQEERRWHAYRPYGYYAPPPVVYPPPVPPPGINLFFHFR
jgi:hypothetical protein